MYWTKKHVLVCTASHCSQKGANEVVGKLRLDIVRKGLDAEILVNTCGTIDLCDIGPNLVIYPDNIIYRGVTTKDLPAIIASLTGGEPVAGLLVDATAPEEVARRTFYAALGVADARSVDDVTERAAAHGFDAAWLHEQQRRGFMARKPAADGSGDELSMTKKARDRYHLQPRSSGE